MSECNTRVIGKFDMVCRDKDGNVKWEEHFDNVATTVGNNHMLDVEYHAETQVTTWYCGLIDNASFSAVSASDTMSSHSGWIELTAYSESVRQTWTEGAASSGSMTNSTAMVFTANATKTVNGAFLTSSSTKSGTTGTLASAGSFSATQAVVSSDTISVTYTRALS